ncbi:MAG: DnaJ domain-containing protein [Peptococcaceae bacterium]|nr:DnaJ domain-containing protein [Peptococcaceae bacterium]
MAIKNYYEILGIPPHSGPHKIKYTYRMLAKKHHPDRFQDPKERVRAEALMKEINEAYEVLSDPEKRDAYDKARRQHALVVVDSPRNQERSQTGKIMACHRHPDRAAVATCRECGRGLCVECSAAFTVMACTVCVQNHNSVTMKKMNFELMINIMFIIFSFIAGAYLCDRYSIATYDPRLKYIAPFWVLGNLWGLGFMLEMAKIIFLGTVSGGIIASMFLLIIVLSVGWIPGLVVGLISFIKLLVAYPDNLGKARQAEAIIRNLS